MTQKSGGRLSFMSKVIILVCLGVFMCSGALIFYYIKGTTGADRDLKSLKSMSDTKTEKEAGDQLEESVDLYALRSKNSDVLGWITVDGTRIDYPVMRCIWDDDYYLHRNFEKEYSESGTPFMDADSSRRSLNWLIYGHNMKIGTMFHDLLKYADRDFWEGHRTFCYTRFENEEGSSESSRHGQVTETYTILAAGYSKIYGDDADTFRYYGFASIKSSEAFETYIDGIKAISCYDTGVGAEYGDQLITLSTCAYHVKNGRFFIVGVRT